MATAKTCKKCTPQFSGKNRNRALGWNHSHCGSLGFTRSRSSLAARISAAIREDLAATVWIREVFRQRKKADLAVGVNNSNRNSRRLSAVRKFSPRIARFVTRRMARDQRVKVIRPLLVPNLQTAAPVV